MPLRRHIAKPPTWFPLDGIGSPALTLLSTCRRLRRSYNGPISREYRSSDGQLTDVPICGPGIGYLNTRWLEAHCAATTGAVKSVYDQSGAARDASQGTASLIPLNISTPGTMLSIGGLPLLRFDGANDCFDFVPIGLMPGTSPALTVAWVSRVTTPGGMSVNIGGNSTSGQVFTWGTHTTATNLQASYSGASQDHFTVPNATTAAHAYILQHAAGANLNTDTLEVDGAAVSPASTGSQSMSLRADSMRWGAHITSGGGTTNPISADFTCLLVYNAVLVGRELELLRNCLGQHMRA